jgi:hypothetical protein
MKPVGKEMSERMWITIDLEMDRDCDIQLTSPRWFERIVVEILDPVFV